MEPELEASTITPTSTATRTPAPPPPCLPVTWTNTANVTVTGNTIQKTGGAGSTWDAGAVSTQSIVSGDGYVQATVDVTSTYRWRLITFLVLFVLIMAGFLALAIQNAVL